MWLGYVIGPFGMLVGQSIVNSYFNQYLTDVIGFTVNRAAWIATFMVMFPILSKIIDAVTNIVMGRVIVSYNLYYSVCYTMWNMSKELSAALSTSNPNQRKNNSMAATITMNVGTGLVSIMFPMILTAVCAAVNGDNATGYFLAMSIMAIIAIPLVFIQYFYTRERVTEERRAKAAAGITEEKAQIKGDQKMGTEAVLPGRRNTLHRGFSCLTSRSICPRS